MAIAAVKGLVAEWYTPEQKGEEEEKTSFEIKPLNGLIAMEVLAEGRTDADGNLHIPGAAMLKTLKHGLVDWKNLNDEGGRPIKFSIANFHRLPAMVLNEIAQEIISISQLTGDDEKN